MQEFEKAWTFFLLFILEKPSPFELCLSIAMPLESFSTLNPPRQPGVALPIVWLTFTDVAFTEVEKNMFRLRFPEAKTIRVPPDFNSACRYLHGHQHRCLWVVPVPRPRWMSSWRRALMPSRGGATSTNLGNGQTDEFDFFWSDQLFEEFLVSIQSWRDWRMCSQRYYGQETCGRLQAKKGQEPVIGIPWWQTDLCPIVPNTDSIC